MDAGKMRAQAGVLLAMLAGCWLACSAAAMDSTLEQGEFTWGGGGSIPVSADYDGDGLSDPALYQESAGQWRVLLSSRLYADNVVYLGGPGYEPVVGDYDGDGRYDPAVYLESTGEWFAMLSGSGYEPTTAILGGPGYYPVASDYDGDGLTDVAVYRSDTGHWVVWMHVEPDVTDTNLLALMYSNAVVNASNVTAGKIQRNLTSITPDNTNLIWRTNPDTGVRELLVTAFMRAGIAANYHVGQYSLLRYGDTWVTAVPELKNVCRSYAGTNLLLRLKQKLGLPMTIAYDTIVEYYVNPLYLLRPSRDPEIADRESEIAFRTNTPYADMVSTNYTAWFQRTIDSRNYGMTNGVWSGWPWTQLGYTYDWFKTGSAAAGLSEFVVPGEMLYNPPYTTNVLVYVVTVTSALDYAATPDNKEIPFRVFNTRGVWRAVDPAWRGINVAPRDDH